MNSMIELCVLNIDVAKFVFMGCRDKPGKDEKV